MITLQKCGGFIQEHCLSKASWLFTFNGTAKYPKKKNKLKRALRKIRVLVKMKKKKKDLLENKKGVPAKLHKEVHDLNKIIKAKNNEISIDKKLKNKRKHLGAAYKRRQQKRQIKAVVNPDLKLFSTGNYFQIMNKLKTLYVIDCPNKNDQILKNVTLHPLTGKVIGNTVVNVFGIRYSWVELWDALHKNEIMKKTFADYDKCQVFWKRTFEVLKKNTREMYPADPYTVLEVCDRAMKMVYLARKQVDDKYHVFW
jgi:hypothetical protein